MGSQPQGKGSRKLLGAILKEMGAVSEGEIQEALDIQRQKGGLLGEILVSLGFIDESKVAMALGVQGGMEFFDIGKSDIPPDVIDRIDPSTASLFRVMPVRFEKGLLTVALADPLNANMLDDLEFIVNAKVKGVIGDEKAVDEAIARHYGAAAPQNMEAIVSEFKTGDISGKLDLSDNEAMAHAGPVVKLLNYILFQAIRDKASDIHLEPFEEEFKIRYRVDGVLYEMESPPRTLAVPLVSRVKVMANLDIAETRIPQDGRIELSIGGNAVDLRVSTLPAIHGESCVMRVLDRSVVSLDLEKLGLREDDISSLRKIMVKPHGIVLVTGPTGSGKTTTLYSVLSEINQEAVKIITTEDPVEYDIDGIVQIPINDEIGVTYGRVLRTILRQDPDIILIGEIRDRETARIAVEASLTGHLVFSTLHTNDAPSTITRMIDIGIEPFLLTATLENVVAQRLVRRICGDCKQYYTPDDNVLLEINLDRDEIVGKKFAYGKGCENCNYSGYRGRLAIYEIMPLSERIKQMILDESSTHKIREAAQEEGMRGLRESGLLAVYDGFTTVEEVIRETMMST
jgi:type IV pilus assembly protein PilB